MLAYTKWFKHRIERLGKTDIFVLSELFRLESDEVEKENFWYGYDARSCGAYITRAMSELGYERKSPSKNKYSRFRILGKLEVVYARKGVSDKEVRAFVKRMNKK